MAKIKDLKDFEILEILKKYKSLKNNLEEYHKVNIVNQLNSKTDKFYNDSVLKIKEVFFKALDRLPKVVNSIDKYAEFLLKNLKQKQFLSEYSEIIYQQLKFPKVENFQAMVLQTKNLTKYFNLIINLNVEILGKSMARNINVGLIQLLIIQLKKIYLIISLLS